MGSWKRLVVRKRVIVNTEAHAFSGILYKKAGPLLVLRDVQLLEPGAPPVPVSGEVLIERTKVEFIQIAEA